MKWKWKDKDNGSSAARGPLCLEVWSDDSGVTWLAAFDVKNGKEMASDYGTSYKNRDKAKEAAEKIAKRWIERVLK